MSLQNNCEERTFFIIWFTDLVGAFGGAARGELQKQEKKGRAFHKDLSQMP